MANTTNSKTGKKRTQVTKKSRPQIVYALESKHYLVLGGILLLTLLSYLPVFHNGFVNYDDDKYVFENTNIIKPLGEAVKFFFTTFSHNDGYNASPVLMSVYALEYTIAGLKPELYHAVNLLLHLMNVMLVFWFIYWFSSRKFEVAAIVALLFAIHPMHVETVAWVADLKDLLYTIFFLGSSLCYYKYINPKTNRKIGWYLLVFVLYIFMMLSKPIGLTFWAVLFLYDFYLQRKFDIYVLFEKVPFLLLAIFYVILNLSVIQTNEMNEQGTFASLNIFQSAMVASYSMLKYVLRLFFPINLCSFYPYPILNEGQLPVIFMVALFVAVVLFYFIYRSLKYTRLITFGFLFFLFTVAVTLQYGKIYGYLTADRYTYLPYIGLLFIIGMGLHKLWNTKYKTSAITLLSIIILIFSVETYARCGVWESGMTLWTDVISQYKTLPGAYYNRGNLFKDENQLTEALADYNKAIELKPEYAEAYNNRAAIYFKESKYSEALMDYNKVIELDPKHVKTYNNRGTIYLQEKRFEDAIKEFNKAIELKPDYPSAYYNRGNAFMGIKRFEEAINDFTKAIEYKPNYPEAYFNKGISEYDIGKKDAACTDIQKSESMGYTPGKELYKQYCH